MAGIPFVLLLVSQHLQRSDIKSSRGGTAAQVMNPS